MAFVIADRVQVTVSAPGSATTITLGAAVTGFQDFAVIGNGNSTYYTIADQSGSNWEVGIGTYTSSGTTLSRDTVLSNSAGNTSRINFSSGTQNVFVTQPASVSGYVSSTPAAGQILIADGTTGAFSGNTNLSFVSARSEFRQNNSVMKINALGSGSGARSIDLSLGNFVTATATGSSTWTVTNTTGGSSYANIFVIELTNGGVATQTWMSGTKWPSGAVPSLQSSGVDVLTFITDDNGTTWRGALSMSNSS